MVSLHTSTVVDRGFDPRSGQIRLQNWYLLLLNCLMCTLLLQWANTIKIQLKLVVLVQDKCHQITKI